MNDSFFSERLAFLRAKKGVSAREMSLAIGQNESYINRIENGHAYPSMQCFYYICEYLNVTPSAFFFDDSDVSSRLRAVLHSLEKLNDRQLSAILTVAETMADGGKKA